MHDEPDFVVEIDGLGESEPISETPRRAWIGVHFECCDVYVRIYKNPAGDAYEGRCPRCLQKVRARVGPGGTSARFFSAN
ncbi:MAG: hypothetical protein DHS20C16_26890 [Phycisphaerae bacterium]|nr:MAG: hypothetical protein DHS20C16_26890 [Phycisphaerae bacterium]